MSMADSVDLRISQEEAMPYGLETINLIVGADKSLIQIPKQLLLSRSSFFANLVHNNSSENNIVIPDFSLWDIQCYKQFLYHGKIMTKEQKPCHWCFKQAGPCGGCFYDKSQERLGGLVQLFLLGEKFQDTSFCDSVISSFMAEYTEYKVLPGPKLINVVYKKTLRRSPLRRLLVDVYAAYDEGRLVICKEAGFPKSFLEDLTHKVYKQIFKGEVRRNWPEDFSCCEYHQHAPDAECRSRKRKRQVRSEEREEGARKKARS